MAPVAGETGEVGVTVVAPHVAPVINEPVRHRDLSTEVGLYSLVWHHARTK